MTTSTPGLFTIIDAPGWPSGGHTGIKQWAAPNRNRKPSARSAFDKNLELRIAMTSEYLPGAVSAPERRERAAAACIAVICAFAAMTTLATNIFLPSLPPMAATLGVSSAAVTSAITIYLAIFAVGQLIVGPLSDRFGRRPLILAGLCLFVAGTIWCALAGDLSGLLIGRSIQASGGCAALVLSRAIARDLFEGQMLAKVMAAITIATAAAPGFSPLLGGALDHFLGWRSEFVFVAVFAAGAMTAYALFVGETIRSTRTSIHPLTVAASYLALVRDIRFVVPARTAGLLMVGLFAIFSNTPRLFAEGFGFSPIALGLLFAAVVFVVFGAGMLATKLSARLGLHRATTVGLAITVIGGVALLLAVLVARDSFPPYLAAIAIFLFGLGIASPLSSAAALAPFGDKAGVAAALLGFAQMAGGASGALAASAVSRDPALGLGIVLALAPLLAFVLYRLGIRRSSALR
jgi:MFS transporter, DHA1 family, multidrug resistance protein